MIIMIFDIIYNNTVFAEKNSCIRSNIVDSKQYQNHFIIEYGSDSWVLALQPFYCTLGEDTFFTVSIVSILTDSCSIVVIMVN